MLQFRLSRIWGERAFKNFFKRKPIINYLDGSISLDFNQIKLPRIGSIKTFEILPDHVTPKSVTISRVSDICFVSFKTETVPQNTNKFEGAQSKIKLEPKLSRLQYLNRHQTKFCNNWKKSQLKIVQLHSRIANIRKDTLHQLTTYLAKNHNPPPSATRNAKFMHYCLVRLLGFCNCLVISAILH
ncbi:MAG: hypothetical protein F6K40_30320 [Okeania sp. SIO3I5]|uniref:hypothetical protein n=1 Tax=Okeania sp. SIO3I5 TaxID=2607805 RepID=UPI0013B98951|nr:hypothetical protein [Okeania sp. SIO3I5]NEQ40302.1 hypothetical protein [Okeania sp. SIO3I5]